jgi:hypothetical protein
MDPDFTRNQLILYLYNETWMADSVLIQRRIDHDPAVEIEFEYLKEILGKLDDAVAEPSADCLSKVMSYI